MLKAALVRFVRSRTAASSINPMAILSGNGSGNHRTQAS